MTTQWVPGSLTARLAEPYRCTFNLSFMLVFVTPLFCQSRASCLTHKQDMFAILLLNGSCLADGLSLHPVEFVIFTFDPLSSLVISFPPL